MVTISHTSRSSEQQLKLIFKGDMLEDLRCVKDLGLAEDEFLVVDKAQEDAPRLLGSLKARDGRGDAKDVKTNIETEEAQRPSTLLMCIYVYLDEAQLEAVSEQLPAVKELVQKAKSLCDCYEQNKSKFVNGAIASLAAIAKFRDDMHQAASEPSIFGWGVGGILAALCAAGVMADEHCLRLAKLADDALSAQAGGKKQRTIRISGLGVESVSALCQTAAAKKDGDMCAISWYSPRNNFFVSGTEQAICRFEELAKASPGHCTVVTQFSGIAYGCSLMQTAQEKFNAALDSQMPTMNSPTTTVWMPTTAKPFRPGTDPKEIMVELKRMMTSPSLAHQCLKAALQDGVRECYYYIVDTAKINKVPEKELERLRREDEIPN
ncbi:MCAT [Symbiodinium microadriaticum]|nr:MCAT [Symbiodinium microadriaticum]